MKKLSKQLLSLLLVVVMLTSTFASLTATTNAASYKYNSGKRGIVCTSLSTSAKSYWSGTYSYDNLKNKSSSALRTTLRTKVSSGTTVGYNGLRTYMKYTDAYQGSTSKLMLFYSSGTTTSTWDNGKTWNREHMWPQSLGGTAVEADLHAMRPADPTANSSRGNHKYGEVASGYTTFKTSSKNGSLTCGYYKNDIFEPLDNVKGDCARVILYDYVRSSSMSSVTEVFTNVSTLLNWMKMDPVDTFEMSRNDSVQSIQGNRNPFIDYPELGWLVLGYSIPSGLTTPSSGKSSSSSGSSSSSSSSTPATFTRVTSTSGIGKGNYILVVKAAGPYKGNYSYYVLTRQSTNSSYVVATGQNWTSVPTALTCNPSSTLVWAGAGSSSAWKLSGGGNVLRASSNSLYYGTGTATQWKVTYSSGTFKLVYSSRYLGLRDDLSGTGSNGCPRFRCNTTAKTTSYEFYIYKQN